MFLKNTIALYQFHKRLLKNKAFFNLNYKLLYNTGRKAIYFKYF